MTKELMNTLAVRVQEKGQVANPLEIRRKLNLKQGDIVTFVETETGIMIKPTEVIVSEALDEIGSVLRTKGISFLDELIERGREIRGEIVEEDLLSVRKF